MAKYKSTPAPWTYYDGYISFKGSVLFAIDHIFYDSDEAIANLNLCVLAPTLHEVVTKCQEVLSQYLEPEGKTKEEAIKELLDILDDKELVIKLKELEK